LEEVVAVTVVAYGVVSEDVAMEVEMEMEMENEKNS